MSYKNFKIETIKMHRKIVPTFKKQKNNIVLMTPISDNQSTALSPSEQKKKLRLWIHNFSSNLASIVLKQCRLDFHKLSIRIKKTKKLSLRRVLFKRGRRRRRRRDVTLD